jgi:hypothetical protein
VAGKNITMSENILSAADARVAAGLTLEQATKRLGLKSAKYLRRLELHGHAGDRICRRAAALYQQRGVAEATPEIIFRGPKYFKRLKRDGAVE